MFKLVIIRYYVYNVLVYFLNSVTVFKFDIPIRLDRAVRISFVYTFRMRIRW